MKANKLMKMIIAAVIILFALGIVISTSVSIGALNKQFENYRNEIENLKYLKQTAKYLYKNGEWDTDFAREVFGEYRDPDYDPYYSSSSNNGMITNEYDDVIDYLDYEIEQYQGYLNSSLGTPVALLLLGLGMFLVGGATLATCFIKDKGETAPAEGEGAPKREKKAKKEKKAKAPAAPAVYETPAPAAPITYLECPACHGRIPVITGQPIITCEQCGEAYQNPYME